jgi:peptide chain release factor subunit 1
MSDATDRTVDHELRERIETIGDLKGRGSDLLTLSVRPDQSLGTVLEEVEEDHAEIEYIEEDTRQFRRDALENLRRILREYESTPDQGLIVYTGVVDDELIEYVFDDLPEPVGTAVYRAANDFSTEPLESIAGSAATYGLLVLERGRAVLGAVTGGRTELLRELTSEMEGKHSPDGQSDDQYENERQREKEDFFETVAEEATREFLGEDPVDRLLLGGTTVMIEEFRDGEYLDYRLEERTVGGTFTVEYASEQGLRELVERAEPHLEPEQQVPREVLDRFYGELESDGEVVYGHEDVAEALTYGAVETALVSEALSAEAIAEIGEQTADIDGEYVLISTDFEDGERFYEAFDGVGALLRYPIE